MSSIHTLVSHRSFSSAAQAEEQAVVAAIARHSVFPELAYEGRPVSSLNVGLGAVSAREARAISARHYNAAERRARQPHDKGQRS